MRICFGCENPFESRSASYYCDNCRTNGVLMECERCGVGYTITKSQHLGRAQDRRGLVRPRRDLCRECTRMASTVGDETGKTYGCLTVIDFDKTKNGRAYWLCECECGDVRAYSGSALRSKGDSRICTHNEKARKAIRSDCWWKGTSFGDWTIKCTDGVGRYIGTCVCGCEESHTIHWFKRRMDYVCDHK